jgi:urease accessory protein UreE
MILFEKLANQVNVEKTKEVITNRQDAMRGRVRTKLSDGEDLIINLPRGQSIAQGDIFGPSEKGDYYKILIEPELVIKVTLDESKATDHLLEKAIRLGYNLGNRHLEVLMEDNAVFVPVTIGEEKVKKILESMKLPIRFESVQKVISTASAGYHAGEEEEF